MRIVTRLAVCSALLALLAGCGSGHDAAPAAAAAAARKKAAPPADAFSRTLVAAVPSIKAGTPPIPVQVKFALHDHPQVGTPVDMDLAVIPTTGTLDV